MVNSPLIRPAISWGKRGIGGFPLGSHEKRIGFYASEIKVMEVRSAPKLMNLT